MTISFNRLRLFVAAALLLLATQLSTLAGSATWSSTPISGDWNTAANWVPQTVPNDRSDVATFGNSSQTSVSSSEGAISLDSLVFSAGAPAYTISYDISGFFFYGDGIVNNSGSLQSFRVLHDGDLGQGMNFYVESRAGDLINFTSIGGILSFNDSSSAGSATFDLSSDSIQGVLGFWDYSTAENATINASESSLIMFYDSATGGDAILNLSSAASACLTAENDAEHMTATCTGGSQIASTQIDFTGPFCSAGDGTFTTIGGSTSGEKGGLILFDSTATAGNAIFVINGAKGAGLSTTELVFTDHANAANAAIIANGGADSSDGGLISFQEEAKGGDVFITLNGNATLDITLHDAPRVNIGSLEGTGSVLLGGNTLMIGSNLRSTVFSGVIQGSGGVIKIGRAALTLTGGNTYSGTTTVSGGVLLTTGRRGSATGTGAVNVNSGTLAGNGIIAGATTIGPGSGDGAYLAPSAGQKKKLTLTIESSLTVNANATYLCTFKARGSRTLNDKVVADGVTINSGALITLNGEVKGEVTPGLTLTLISNTSASPISGTFSNLDDGAVVTFNDINFQASYSGGDGNDLTLTVVP